MPPCPSAGEVMLWHAHTREAWADAAAIARAERWLTPAEHIRYARFRHDSDRQMFLLGRVMARRLIGCALGVAPDAWEWRAGLNGRPEVGERHAPMSFNLAHSAGVVVCALASDRAVGADVEHRLRAATDRRLVRRFCSPPEIADIEAGGDEGWRDRFLRYWTLKEAYLKARGLGIAVPLADVSFSLEGGEVRMDLLNGLAGSDPRWAFTLITDDDAHFVAVAASTADGVRPRFTRAPFVRDLLP